MSDPRSEPELRIGTRGSALALAQAGQVRDALARHDVPARLVVITTEGDRREPDTAWGEGAFVGAIEAALLEERIDVAVHSAKDVPTDEDPRLTIAAYLERASPLDTIVLPEGRQAASLADLPASARVGTDSPRRSAFLRAARPDLRLHPLHGNVDTRLRRLDAGETDALVLAEAGLTRLGRQGRISIRVAPEVVPPAPGQGAIAVQIRAGDAHAAAAVSLLDDAPTRAAVEVERALLAASGGGCRAPVGAYARWHDGRLVLLAGYARPDGTIATTVTVDGPWDGRELARRTLDALAARAAEAARATASPRVIVTRAADQAAASMLALVDRGLTPLSAPAIEVAPIPELLDAQVERLDSFDWIVVTSARVVEALRDAAARIGQPLDGQHATRTRWATVGIATERALRAAGVTVALRPRRATALDLAADLPVEDGTRVLLPRSDLADVSLVERLTARGAVVEAVVAYRTVEAPQSSTPMLAAALAAAPAAIMFTSGSTVRGAIAIARRLGALDDLRSLPAICIGQPTADAAVGSGFRVAATAASQDVAAMAEAAAGYLTSQEER